MQVFIGLVKKAGKILLGQLAEALWNAAAAKVIEVDPKPIPGEEKFKEVYEGVKGDMVDLPTLGKFVLKIFIEALVAQLKNQKYNLLQF